MTAIAPVEPHELEEWERDRCAGVVMAQVRRPSCPSTPRRACRSCKRAYCGRHAYDGICPRCKRTTEPYRATKR